MIPRSVPVTFRLQREDAPLTPRESTEDTVDTCCKTCIHLPARESLLSSLGFYGRFCSVAFQIYPAQDTPLISGGVGFITSTNGGNTTYIPIISPLLAAPLGDHLLVESRATILNSYFPKGNGQKGYTSSSFLGLSYLQLDYLATPHITVVGGEFLTPFGTYNERLTPIWISNFESAPLIFPLGIMNTGSSVGGMLRGSRLFNEACLA